MPDLMSVLVKVGAVAPAFVMLLQVIFAFLGFIFTGKGLLDIYISTNDNSQKFFSASSHTSTAGGIGLLLLGGIMMSFSTLQIVGVLSRSITGNYVNSRLMSYSASGTSAAEQAQMAIMAIMGIMQAVGLTAMFRACISIYDKMVNNSRGNSYGIITGWFLGGLAAWNFKWTADVINNTIGFNIISILTPY